MATANKGMEPGLGLDNLTVLSSLFSRDLIDSLGSGLHGLFGASYTNQIIGLVLLWNLKLSINILVFENSTSKNCKSNYES